MTEQFAAAGQLRALVERIERIEADIADLNGDKSEIYKEARGIGFDVSALREVVALRRKQGKNPQKFDERVAIVELYLTALGDDAATVRLARARTRGEEPSEPDATPAGAVVAETSGATAGETATNTSKESREGAAEPHRFAPEASPSAASPMAAAQTAATIVHKHMNINVPTSEDRPFSRIRPWCQHPEHCVSYGAKHCRPCERAHEDAGAVAA